MLHKASPDVMAAISPALLERGCVNVVRLDAVKNEFGARWPSLRTEVYTRIEALLHQKLGPTDFFTRTDDTSYLVTMPDAEAEDVNVVCLRVTYDLLVHLLGHCDIAHVQLCYASSGDNNTLSLRLVPFEQIISLADKAGIQDFNLPLDQKPDSLAQPRSTLAASSPAAPHDRMLAVSQHFIPIWSVPNNAITTYQCSAKSILEEGSRRLVAPTHLTIKERVQVDLSCLQAGVARLAAAKRNRRFLLGIAISFEVLGTPASRMEFLTACRDLSSEYRQYLDFTLIEVPPGVAQTKLNNLINMLRPFARSVSATVASGHRLQAAYQGVGLRSVGYSMREFADPHALRAEDIRQLGLSAKAMRLGTFIHDIASLDVLRIASAASIQSLSGSAVAPACDEPQGMSRLTWQDILSRSRVAL